MLADRFFSDLPPAPVSVRWRKQKRWAGPAASLAPCSLPEGKGSSTRCAKGRICQTDEVEDVAPDYDKDTAAKVLGKVGNKGRI
jgi:hypothetical protein